MVGLMAYMLVYKGMIIIYFGEESSFGNTLIVEDRVAAHFCK